MFKDIFPNQLNRLVYMGVRVVTEAPSGAEKPADKPILSPAEVAKKRADEVSQLKTFLHHMANESINHILRRGPKIQVKKDLTVSPEQAHKLTTDDKRVLSQAKSMYDSLCKTDADGLVSETTVAAVRTRIEGTFETAYGDSMRGTVMSSKGLYATIEKWHGHPLDRTALRAARREKAKPVEHKEAEVITEWVRIAKLADEIANMKVEDAQQKPVPALVAKRTELQGQLKNMLVTAMKGKGNRVVINNPDGNTLTITRAAGGGSPAFMVELSHIHESQFNVAADQPMTGRGKAANRPRAPRNARARVTQVVYAGGSAKDFPKKS